MKSTDIILLTDQRYVAPTKVNNYINNVLLEDNLVKVALEEKGLTVHRTNWDNANIDWSSTRHIMFRTTWDYFERLEEFKQWLEMVRTKTKLINSYNTILWNIDKHYLLELKNKGINIPPTIFIEPENQYSLSQILETSGWQEAILKPAIAAAARHTYRINPKNVHLYEELFKKLMAGESMLLQEFQHHILTRGEIAFMLFGGKYSHAVLKKAKKDDFRVQDDFGGSVHHYSATNAEIEFAENVVSHLSDIPMYARVDVMIDNNNQFCVSELEMIEPELWFRMSPNAAPLLASAILEHYY